MIVFQIGRSRLWLFQSGLRRFAAEEVMHEPIQLQPEPGLCVIQRILRVTAGPRCRGVATFIDVVDDVRGRRRGRRRCLSDLVHLSSVPESSTLNGGRHKSSRIVSVGDKKSPRQLSPGHPFDESCSRDRVKIW